jgi:hypothetical protein
LRGGQSEILREERMTKIQDEAVEAEARAILREAIQRSNWYPYLSEEERNRRIEQDVEANWPLMLADARKCLEQRKKP